jgi:hypothetical protein
MSATQKIQYKPATTEHDYALARYDKAAAMALAR